MSSDNGSEQADGRTAGPYGWIVAVALLALAPNIVLTTAFGLLQKSIGTDLHMSKLMVQEAEGISNAGYAFGAVVSVFLTHRFRQRPLFIITETCFVASAVLATVAWSAAPYFVGRVIEGLTTGLMLVIALPPLITRYGVAKLPGTAAAVNIGLFGAVTVGPLLAGFVATTSWRIVFAAVAVAGAVGVTIATLALPEIDAFDRERAADIPAFVLAAVATVLPFFGASQLVAAHFGDAIVWAPIAFGLVGLVVLVVLQYRRRDPLMPVRALSTSLPVVGTLAAMVGGAAFVALVELATNNELLAKHAKPLSVGLVSAPAIAGVAVAAFIFAELFRTRFLPMLVLAGLGSLIAGGVVNATTSAQIGGMVASFLLGAGAGATVSPGLFLAGFGVPSNQVGRAFALVELLRSEAAYLVGPILLYVAMIHPPLPDGTRFATWITIAMTAVGTVVLVGLFVASGARLHRPDLETWLEQDEQAMESPPTAQALRERIQDVANPLP